MNSLFLPKPRDQCQDTAQYYRKQDASRQREIKTAILSLNPNVTWQLSQRDAKFRSNDYHSPDHNEKDASQDEITPDGFHFEPDDQLEQLRLRLLIIVHPQMIIGRLRRYPALGSAVKET